MKNVHVHLMICERKIDGIYRDPETYFKRANTKNPELGGAKKDRTWQEEKTLKNHRELFANITNKALERAGIEERVTHKSLQTQAEEELAKGNILEAMELTREPINIPGRILHKNKGRLLNWEKELLEEHKAKVRQLEKQGKWKREKELRGVEKNLEELNRISKKIDLVNEKLESKKLDDFTLNFITWGGLNRVNKRIADVDREIINIAVEDKKNPQFSNIQKIKKLSAEQEQIMELLEERKTTKEFQEKRELIRDGLLKEKEALEQNYVKLVEERNLNINSHMNDMNIKELRYELNKVTANLEDKSLIKQGVNFASRGEYGRNDRSIRQLKNKKTKLTNELTGKIKLKAVRELKDINFELEILKELQIKLENKWQDKNVVNKFKEATKERLENRKEHLDDAISKEEDKSVKTKNIELTKRYQNKTNETTDSNDLLKLAVITSKMNSIQNKLTDREFLVRDISDKNSDLLLTKIDILESFNNQKIIINNQPKANPRAKVKELQSLKEEYQARCDGDINTDKYHDRLQVELKELSREKEKLNKSRGILTKENEYKTYVELEATKSRLKRDMNYLEDKIIETIGNPENKINYLESYKKLKEDKLVFERASESYKVKIDRYDKQELNKLSETLKTKEEIKLTRNKRAKTNLEATLKDDSKVLTLAINKVSRGGYNQLGKEVEKLTKELKRVEKELDTKRNSYRKIGVLQIKSKQELANDIKSLTKLSKTILKNLDSLRTNQKHLYKSLDSLEIEKAKVTIRKDLHESMVSINRRISENNSKIKVVNEANRQPNTWHQNLKLAKKIQKKSLSKSNVDFSEPTVNGAKTKFLKGSRGDDDDEDIVKSR